jgi:hypothetical protein
MNLVWNKTIDPRRDFPYEMTDYIFDIMILGLLHDNHFGDTHGFGEPVGIDIRNYL